MNNIQRSEYFVIRSSQSKFTYEFTLPANADFTHICVTSASIPKTFYVLPNNCSIQINEGSGPISLSFVAGNYTFQSFINIFNNLANTSSLTYKYNLSSTYGNLNNWSIYIFSFQCFWSSSYDCDK